MRRSLLDGLDALAREKFVLLSGPRQVGKTTLARAWAAAGPGRSLYLNWDVPEDRARILGRNFLRQPGPDRLVLDELHKYERWKPWLKGLYDREGPRLQVVVTGSARLELFQKSGESLLGRHEALRLHPLTVGELTHGQIPEPPRDWLDVPAAPVPVSLWRRLERYGGFPEPYLKQDPRQHRRWATRRRTLLVHEDLREISQLRRLSLVEHLALLLPSRVGAPLSLNALREDLGVAHETIASWIDALDRLCFCFRLAPYHRRLARSLTKERKLYLWDWSLVEDEGPRFENQVASHLWKAVQAWTDLGYGEFDLQYWRDKERREVDFVITERRRPVALIECKLGDEQPSVALLRLGAQLGDLPLLQLVRAPDVDRRRANWRVVSADRFLAGLV